MSSTRTKKCLAALTEENINKIVMQIKQDISNSKQAYPSKEGLELAISIMRSLSGYENASNEDFERLGQAMVDVNIFGLFY